ASGTVDPSGTSRLVFFGTLDPAHLPGTSTQIPMVPLFSLSLRGETDLMTPVTLWTSVDYRSKRNVDYSASRTLADLVLVGAGISAHAFSHVSLSFNVSNIFNTGYEWWSGYAAPGRQFTAEAKINLK